MSIRVIRQGLLTSVQDLGRRGRQRFGVSVGGAMDCLALRVANLLVGNDENAAGLEMTLWGPTLEFDQHALIAVCGGQWTPRVDNQTILCWRPVWIRAKTTLSLGSAVQGARAVLAVAGGINVPVVMGSRGTHLPGGFGGFQGRALAAGDRLELGTPSRQARSLMHALSVSAGTLSAAQADWSAAGVSAEYARAGAVRVVRGGQFSWLDAASQAQLCAADFEVTKESDRMGYRLAGPKLNLANRGELISEAVCCGAVQLPPEGQPIVLMADCATTGGYAKIAHVASVDLPRMAQLRPGDKFRLAEIPVSEAQRLYREREAMIGRLKLGLLAKAEG